MSFTFLKIKVIKRICSYSLAQKQGSPFHVFPYFSACKAYHQRKGPPYKPLLSYDAVEQKGKANEMCLLLLSKLQDAGKVVSSTALLWQFYTSSSINFNNQQEFSEA